MPNARQSLRLICQSALVVLSSSSGIFAQSTTHIPAVRDNTLYESPNGSISNGRGAHLFCGQTQGGLRRRAVIAFDLARALPRGAQILDARLVVFFDRTIAGNLPVAVHRLLSAFGEGASMAGFGGEGGGAPAAPGDATWRHRLFPTDFWTQPGGDFAALASATQTIGFATGPVVFSSAGLRSDAQRFLDQPQDDHGWILVSPENDPGNAKRFGSRESSDPTMRPRLEVDWILPGTEFSFGADLSARLRVNGQSSPSDSVFIPSGASFGFTLESTGGTFAEAPLLIAAEFAPSPQLFPQPLLAGSIAVGSNPLFLIGGPTPLLPSLSAILPATGLTLDFGPLSPTAVPPGSALILQAIALGDPAQTGGRGFASTDALHFVF